MNGHGCLIIYGCRECLALACRYGCVGVDELCHYAAHSLDTECQRSDIKQHDVAHTAFLIEDGALNGRTYCHHLVGVHAL